MVYGETCPLSTLLLSSRVSSVPDTTVVLHEGLRKGRGWENPSSRRNEMWFRSQRLQCRQITKWGNGWGVGTCHSRGTEVVSLLSSLRSEFRLTFIVLRPTPFFGAEGFRSYTSRIRDGYGIHTTGTGMNPPPHPSPKDGWVVVFEVPLSGSYRE